MRQMEILHSCKVKSEILWSFKELLDISPDMAGSQRKPAGLIFLGLKSTLGGDIQTGQITCFQGLLPSISFGPTASCPPFGHVWDAAEPCTEGCWLEGRWAADRAGFGELRSRRTYLHEIPIFWWSLWLGLCLGLVPSDTVCSAGMLRAGWIGCLGPEPVGMAYLALHCFSSGESCNMCLLSWMRQ